MASSAGCSPNWRRSNGEPPRLVVVRSNEPHLGRALPADQGCRRRRGAPGTRAGSGRHRRRAPAADRDPQARARAAAAVLALGPAVRAGRDHRALAVAVGGRDAPVQFAQRAADRVSADSRGRLRTADRRPGPAHRRPVDRSADRPRRRRAAGRRAAARTAMRARSSRCCWWRSATRSVRWSPRGS